MSYKFLSTIQAISATFTGNSVYSNSTPNRTVKVDATGLYLSRTSDGAYPSSITADGSMYYNTRNSHIFRNDGTTSMTLFDNTRNVGIGTSTDAGYKLDVNGTAKVSGISYLIGGLLVSNYGSTIAGGQSISGSGAGNYDFNNGSGSGWYFNWIQNGATAMRLSSGNNLLIGTTTDAGYKLDVNGTARIYGASTSSLMIDTVGTADMASSITFRQNSPNWSSSIGTHTSGGGLHYGLQFKSQPSTVNFVINRDGSTYFGGFGLANSSSLVELSSTTKGFLQPRMTTTQRNAIATPATGLSIYNTTTNTEDYYNGSAWVSLQTSITNPVTGTGTTNYLSKWTSSSTLNNSLLYDDGTNVGIGTTTPSYTLDVNGNLRAITSGIVGNAAAFSGGFGGLMSVRKDLDITAGGTYRNAQLAVGSTTNNGALLLGYSTTGIGSIQAAVMGVSYSSLSIQGFGGNLMVGTTTDAGYKLDVNGTLRAQGKLTITTGGTEITGTAVLYSGAQSYGQVQIFSGSAFQMFNGANNSKASFQYINANGLLLTTNSDNISGVLKGLQVNPTMVAAANNDVLVGLDITPTFTNGAFTGVSNYALRSAGNIAFTAGANRYLTMQNPSSSGSANHIIIQGASANTSGTGGNIYLYEGSGAGGPGPGSIYIGATTGWTTTYITGQATISSTGPTTGTVFQVNAGGQNGLTINWDNSTPYMGYGLVVNRQSRFYNSSSYTFDNNLIIGSNTNAGYKLDVNGTTRINSTLSLTNSTYAGTFSFYLSAANVFQASSSNVGVWLQVGGGNRVYIIGQEFNSTARGNIFGNTVGGEAISATTIIAQSSGTTATTGLSLRYTINNTGTYVGISRGIYYNPTITSLTGTTHRAIETVTGDVIFGSTSGVVGIGTTSLSTEANLYLGAKSTLEGGQLVLQKGTSQTYATHLDNYNNQFRVMVGTDTGSTAAQLIVMHATGNVLINSGTDNGYKLQVAGDVNVNTGSTTNNLVVNADTSMFYNLTSGGGQVKSNVYTTSVATRYYVPASSTEYLIEWDPTLCQGIFVDYVLMIVGLNYIRSGTLVIANDNGGNVTITDNINSSVNGSSTAFVTFSAAGAASIKLGCDNLLSTNDAYVNIITRYIPNIY